MLLLMVVVVGLELFEELKHKFVGVLGFFVTAPAAGSQCGVHEGMCSLLVVLFLVVRARVRPSY